MDELIEDIKQDMIYKLESGIDCLFYDLHHELCNTDYFIIGRYQAKKWLGDNVFNAIEKIKEWENDNIGEVTTDFSDPEKVCNMLAYIVSEELLEHCKILEPFGGENMQNVQMDEHRTQTLIRRLKNFNNYLHIR